MATNISYGTQGNGLGAQQQAYIDKLMTTRLAQQTLFDKFATIQKALPQNSGTKITFRKWVPMRDLMLANTIYKNYTGNDVANRGESVAQLVDSNLYSTYALTEGDTQGNKAGSMKVVEYSTDIIGIGMWMDVTEEVAKFHDMYTIAENVEQYSEVAALIIDEFYRDTYINGAGHVQDITSGGSGADNVADSAFTSAIRKISMQLRLSNGKYINSILSSSPNIGTEPIWSRYIGIINPLAGEALKANTDFISLEKYSAGVKPLDGEIGMIGDVRIIENPNMLIEDDGAGGYNATILIMAKDHSANIPVRGGKINGQKRLEVIVKGFGGQDKSDPLNRIATIGWKSWLGAYTINPEKLGKIVAKFNMP